MTPEEKELLRENILNALYHSLLGGLSVAGIAMRIRHAFPDATERDIKEAIAILQGLGFVEIPDNKLGVSITNKLTSEGAIYCERNGLV